MTTQNDSIFAALVAGRRITPLDALQEFGCFRLGSRIWDLRQILGADAVVKQNVKLPSGKTVAEYHIPEEMREQARMTYGGASR